MCLPNLCISFKYYLNDICNQRQAWEPTNKYFKSAVKGPPHMYVFIKVVKNS